MHAVPALLLAMLSLATPVQRRCWQGSPVPGIGAGQITSLAIGAGKLWVSLLRVAEPVPGWGGGSTTILRMDLQSGRIDDVTKVLNPNGGEGPHIDVDEARKEVWVTFDAGGCGQPDAYDVADLSSHYPHKCNESRPERPAFLTEREKLSERLALPGADVVLAYDDRHAVLEETVSREHPGDNSSRIYLRRVGGGARSLFESKKRFTISSAALTPRLALLAAGPDGLVLIDRDRQRAVRSQQCGREAWVAAVAAVGDRVFVGTAHDLRQMPLSELDNLLVRSRSAKKKPGAKSTQSQPGG